MGSIPSAGRRGSVVTFYHRQQGVRRSAHRATDLAAGVVSGVFFFKYPVAHLASIAFHWNPPYVFDMKKRRNRHFHFTSKGSGSIDNFREFSLREVTD
jgi:hypothetical protein